MLDHRGDSSCAGPVRVYQVRQPDRSSARYAASDDEKNADSSMQMPMRIRLDNCASAIIDDYLRPAPSSRARQRLEMTLRLMDSLKPRLPM